MIADKLKLLSIADGLNIHNNSDGSYEISLKDEDSDLVMIIKDDMTEFYITGCYDSSCDWIEINMDDLNKLKEFNSLLRSTDE